MKTSSPSKHLIDMNLTPAKQIVSCDINGWMETHEKHGPAPQTQRWQAKPPKPGKSTALTPKSTLAQLRAQRSSILKSTAKKKIGLAELKTAGSSAEISSAGSHNRFNSEGFYIRSLSKKKENQPVIEVSQFRVDEAALLQRAEEKRGEGGHKRKGTQLMKLSEMVGGHHQNLNRLLLRCGNGMVKSGATNHQYRSLSSVNRRRLLNRS